MNVTALFLNHALFITKKIALSYQHAVCACVRVFPFQLLNHLTDFQETSYGRYAFGDYINVVF
jgi:hypothetical protein